MAKMKSTSVSLILIISISGTLEVADAGASSSHQQQESNDSKSYVETEVLNFNEGTAIDQTDVSLPIAECNAGIFAPKSMKIYKNNMYHCGMACSIGCLMGYGAYEEPPTSVPLKENKVICYLMKVQANFRIARMKKVTTRGKKQRFYRCHCGLYIGDKFSDCSKMFVKYAGLEEYPIDLEQDSDANMRLACMNSCDVLDAIVSMRSGKPFLVGCGMNTYLDKVLDYRTYALEGECVHRDGDVKCVCGVPTTKKVTFNCEDPLKRPTKKFVYHLNMTASIEVRDNRVHNLKKYIYEPKFFIPVNFSEADGCMSSNSKPAPKYKKSAPSIGLISPSMSPKTVKFLKMKREVETIHLDTIAPRNMNMSSINAYNFASQGGDERSVNQLAVQKSWVTESRKRNVESEGEVSKIEMKGSKPNEESKREILKPQENFSESMRKNLRIKDSKSKMKASKSKKKVPKPKKVSESKEKDPKSKNKK